MSRVNRGIGLVIVAAVLAFGARTASAQQRSPTASLGLPTQIEVLHTAEYKWPTRLTLASREGSIGHYVGNDYRGDEARATVQILSDGTVRMNIEVPKVGYSGEYNGKLAGSTITGEYDPSTGFGPHAPFKATVSGMTSVMPPSQEVQTFPQTEERDASGRITREASIIHVVQCPQGQQIYVYQYTNRAGFRAIRPPDWGHPLGGRDFGTKEEATAAGCSAMR